MTNLFDADSHPEGILLNISSELHASQDRNAIRSRNWRKQVWCFCKRNGSENIFLCSYYRIQPEDILCCKEGKGK